MGYQTYKTEREALVAVDAMAGWDDAGAHQLHLPDDANADADGDVWVVGVRWDFDGPTMYLRDDGAVR